MTPHLGQSAVGDFVAELLRAFGYTKHNRFARIQRGVTFFIHGELEHAQTNVCRIDRDQTDIFLLVQEDKRLGKRDGGADLDLSICPSVFFLWRLSDHVTLCKDHLLRHLQNRRQMQTSIHRSSNRATVLELFLCFHANRHQPLEAWTNFQKDVFGAWMDVCQLI
jgi:hypothetical protein